MYTALLHFHDVFSLVTFGASGFRGAYGGAFPDATEGTVSRSIAVRSAMRLGQRKTWKPVNYL